MTVIFEKRELPIVSVAFAVRYGGINESAEERGIAHFIEHMLYKGTKSRTHKQISEEIEKNGGILNGFTDEPLTAFWCKMPSKHLDTALNVLGDMIKNPLFEEKEIEKERKVIFEEMKIYHDNPDKYVFDKIQELLYRSPLNVPLIGTHQTMNSIGRDQLVNKFREIYKPGNMILCVVGDADFNKLVATVERNFVGPKGKIKTPKVSQKNETRTEKRKGIDQANIVLGFHSPLSTDKKVYAVKVLMSLMANGLSSRLFYEIREKRNLAYGVHGGVSDNNFFSYSYVFVGTMKKNVQLVKKLILQEFKKVSKGLTEKELNAAKEQLVGNYHITREHSEGQMNHLLFSEIGGNAKEVYEFEKRVRSVKLKDVKNLAKIKKYSFFALVPE